MSSFNAEMAVLQILSIEVLASDFSLKELNEVKKIIPISRLNSSQKEKVLNRV